MNMTVHLCEVAHSCPVLMCWVVILQGSLVSLNAEGSLQRENLYSKRALVTQEAGRGIQAWEDLA